MDASKFSCHKLFYPSENLTHINLELNRNPCRRSGCNLFSVFEISLCVGLSGTFLLISTSIVGDISRYIDTAYYLDYTNCPSIHVRSYTDLSLTVCLSRFYYPPKAATFNSAPKSVMRLFKLLKQPLSLCIGPLMHWCISPLVLYNLY